MANIENKEILVLKTQIKHLTNELKLTRAEYEDYTKNYFDIYSNMEKMVDERTLELKKLHSILEAKNHEMNTMLDASSELIYYMDVNQIFLRVNKSFADFFKLDYKKIVGRNISDVLDHHEGEIFAEDNKYVITSAESVTSVKKILKTSNGNKHLILDIVPNLDENSNVLSIIGFIRDVTDEVNTLIENKKLQERIGRAEKMEALGLLAGGVAHDGNNILSALIGNMEIMKMDLEENDPNIEYIDSALDAANQMSYLIADLLTLTRAGSNNRTVLCLNNVIEKFRKSPIFVQIAKKSPEIKVEFELENQRLNTLGVHYNIRKAIMNLLTNAVEAFHGEEGTIRITTKKVYINSPITAYDLTVASGEFCVVSVSDTGSGIAKEDLNRIFEPFYTKKIMEKSGTGLGMTVVYGVLKNHDGFIDIHSELGKGTTFELYFPVTDEIVQPEIIVETWDACKGDGESILIVDDIEMQRDFLSDFLTKMDYRVIAVASGEAAIEFLKKNTADLIILDMIMEGGMDGLDTYKEILNYYPEQKAIIASGYSETDRVKEAQSLGAGEYVKKPYTLKEIGISVKRALNL